MCRDVSFRCRIRVIAGECVPVSRPGFVLQNASTENLSEEIGAVARLWKGDYFDNLVPFVVLADKDL